MWGGSTILASGLTAIFTSRLKSLASVKTFCISSLIAMFTSLTMLILSAGGLTLTSSFYTRIDPTEYYKRTSNLIHSSLLVISVFCLSGNILALIVCCKYIFFEHHEKPKHRRRHRNLPEGSSRSTTLLRGGAPNINSSRSTNSRTPLQNDSSSRRHSDNTDVNRVQIEYRRSHRRTASDQLHSNSRRQRHSHQETGNTCSNNSNLLSPSGVRYYLDRRNANSRSSSQGRDVKDLDRLNIHPFRNSCSANSRSGVQATIQVRLSQSPVTHEIRLPTEFDEEELPPYEVVDPRAPVDENGETASDSGDESDTENSSSTEAESYNVEVGLDGAESFPMVPLQNANRSETNEHNGNLQNCNSCEAASHPLLLNSCTGHHLECTGHRTDSTGHQLERQANGVPIVKRSNKLTNSELTGATGTMIVRKDSSRSNRPVLSYINTNISDQFGDYERLVSVSPEVCAITGESPELHLERHSLHENFYENGPCYENVRCVGKGLMEPGLNYLSKASSPKVTTDNCDEVRNVSTSGRNVPMQVLSLSPQLSPSSPPLSPGNIGSSISAFRPVGSLTHIEHTCLNDNCSVHNSTVETVHPPHASPLPHRHELRDDSPSDVTSRFKEQGAIPKNVKSRENVTQKVDKSNLSWKNILLPLSYNHSESASNEGEKKLPSKTIPFTDSDTDISKPSKVELSSFESSKLSPRVYPLTAQNLLSSIRPTVASPTSTTESTLGAAASFTQSRSNSNDDNSKQTVVHPHVSPIQNPVTSSVKEASTQASSVSRWHSHRMGGTQSLLQSRRDEMQNSHLSRQALELSTRSNRPSSMPASGGISALAVVTGRTDAAALPPAEVPRPLSLRSYLVNPSQQIQHSQSLALRQNHLHQHYPLQPQQPRLGVQLHQRRHQQHQLQQNIESQQQQLQQQQQQLQQQQQQEGNEQLQPARNGRPLFSVLL
ncbi:CAunnamed protein product [Biomphalaria glabrata]|nr:CAunnamed protein product [Biomphalaria glabrata]